MLIHEALDLLKSRPAQGPHGYVIVGVGPGKSGDLVSLARHVREQGGVGLWLLMSPDWAEEAYEVLREANLIGTVQVHARPLNKVCAVSVDLFYVDPVGGVSDMSLDPYVKLYQDARHLLGNALVAISKVDTRIFTGAYLLSGDPPCLPSDDAGGSALASVFMAAGWQVTSEVLNGNLILERR